MPHVPYHLASNGLAERAVQTLKCAMKKLTKGSLEDKSAEVFVQVLHYPTINHRSFTIRFAIWQTALLQPGLATS